MSALPATMATMPSATRIPVAQFSQMSCLVRMVMPPGSPVKGAIALSQYAQMIIIRICERKGFGFGVLQGEM
jgi:hypothetical protein